MHRLQYTDGKVHFSAWGFRVFQGGWVYARVARLLREAGHEVYTLTPTLKRRPVNTKQKAGQFIAELNNRKHCRGKGSTPMRATARQREQQV
jgi:hypothetical protein